MVERYSSASPYEATVGFSRAVRVGRRIVVAGTAPIGADGRTVEGDALVQARRCLEIILDAVAALGGRREHVVRTRMFLVDAADQDLVRRAHGEIFGDIRPAATMVVVRELLDPCWRVEIEAEAELEP
jgi:enamine deaminase RidA (YjgF/YER057c/UK114 family)